MTTPADDRMAARLAWAGLVPFVVGAALTWILSRPAAGAEADPHFFVTEALSSYAALVIGVLAGVHWAMGFRDASPDRPRRFAWGAGLAAAAWIGNLMPAYAGLVVHGVLLVVSYLVDRKTYPLHGIGGWLTLRFRLTAGAALCCFVGAAGS